MDASTDEDSMYGMRGEDITLAISHLFGMEDNPERDAEVTRIFAEGNMEGEGEGDSRSQMCSRRNSRRGRGEGEGEEIEEEEMEEMGEEVQEEEQEEEMAAPAGLSDDTNAGGNTNATGPSSPPPRPRDRRRRRRNALRNTTIADNEIVPRSEVPFGNNTAVDADGSEVQVFENWDTVPDRPRRTTTTTPGLE